MTLPWYIVLLNLGCGIFFLYVTMFAYKKRDESGYSVLWVTFFLYSLICLTIGIDNISYVFPTLWKQSAPLLMINTTCYFLLPITWFLFCMNYLGKEEFLTLKVLALLLFTPLFLRVFRIISLIDPSLGYSYDQFLNDFNYLYDIMRYGYLYGLPIVGEVYLLKRFLSVSKIFKTQIIFLIAGSSIVLISELIVDSNIFPWFEPLGLDIIVSGFLISYGILRYDILQFSPIFRENFFDILNSGLIVLNKNLKIIDVNPIAEKLMNVPLNESFGRHPSEIPSLNPKLKNILESPEKIPDQILTLTGDGIRGYSISAKWIKNKIGTEGAYLVVLTDITNTINLEKQVHDAHIQLIKEKEKRIQNQRYKEFFLSNRDPILIISNNTIIECNPVALEVFGEFCDRIIGMDPTLLSANNQRNIDDITEKFKYYLTLAENGNQVDFSWVFQSGNKRIDAQVRLSHIEYDNQVMIEMSIRENSDIFLQLQTESEKNRYLMSILTEEAHLWNEISKVVHSDSDQIKLTLGCVDPIISKATRNLDQASRYCLSDKVDEQS
nr:histidine kinase N-terminal 7TM domain-containing protein [uncultured Methanospirillum sp.]